ncbi:hypothetical protein, partial [Methylobacterium variabile]|uniref:hypothetical protein n=1 Tax=Methylobacterium variabile TaxID=298794 RepID=UPI001ADF704C
RPAPIAPAWIQGGVCHRGDFVKLRRRLVFYRTKFSNLTQSWSFPREYNKSYPYQILGSDIFLREIP